jgi:dTDP-4-amino-4,6-dideoxygalactose transaminase
LINPYDHVRNFETALADRCGSPFAVSVNTCTNALLLCCAYLKVGEVTIPKHTYIGVAQSILNAGGSLNFSDRSWYGSYYLSPYPIIDSARRMTRDCYVPGTFTCLSFNTTKILKHPQGGGAILLDNEYAYETLKKMRFDGRTEGVAVKDDTPVRGYRCNMKPGHASDLLLALRDLPLVNADLPNDAYPDLSKFPIFSEAV